MFFERGFGFACGVGFRVYGGVGRNVSSKVLVGSTSTT
jgi:hypothetical protein